MNYNLKARIYASVTKRIRHRRYAGGRQVLHERYVVNCRDLNGKRRQLFFRTRREAMAFRDDLIARSHQGQAMFPRSGLMLADVLEHWLAETRRHVKSNTWRAYQRVRAYVIGPLAPGTPLDRRRHTLSGAPSPEEALHLMGNVHLFELSTSGIRHWHNTLSVAVGRRTAQEMKRCLGAALRLAAEDFGVTVPTLPLTPYRGAERSSKDVLMPSQVRQLLAAAAADTERGLYYAFPFLTGMRPSEQLGLLWEDIDLDDASIEIRRVQELDGSLSLATKTATSRRRIPVPALLHAMLLSWRAQCPRDRDGLGRVFPTIGRTYRSGKVSRAGLPLTYYNFRANYWAPALRSCGLPYVTPHSARHTYISALQAAGVEVGLVAKLAGHANANVTLSHYTHAMRGGAEAVQRLQGLYEGDAPLDRSVALRGADE